MKHTNDSPWVRGPEPTYGAVRTLLVTAVLLGAVAALLAAVSYPAVALAVVLLGLAARLSTSMRAARKARRGGEPRRYCVPKTGICIEA